MKCTKYERYAVGCNSELLLIDRRHVSVSGRSGRSSHQRTKAAESGRCAVASMISWPEISPPSRSTSAAVISH